MDRDAVVSGLLHDTVEDTDVTFAEVEAMFGRDVRGIVEGETKVSKLPKMARELNTPDWDAEREQVENMRSMCGAVRKSIPPRRRAGTDVASMAWNLQPSSRRRVDGVDAVEQTQARDLDVNAGSWPWPAIGALWS